MTPNITQNLCGSPHDLDPLPPPQVFFFVCQFLIIHSCLCFSSNTISILLPQGLCTDVPSIWNTVPQIGVAPDTVYIFSCLLIICLTHCKMYQDRHLFCSVLYFQFPAQCLALKKYLLNECMHCQAWTLQLTVNSTLSHRHAQPPISIQSLAPVLSSSQPPLKSISSALSPWPLC